MHKEKGEAAEEELEVEWDEQEGMEKKAAGVRLCQ